MSLHDCDMGLVFAITTYLIRYQKCNNKQQLMDIHFLGFTPAPRSGGGIISMMKIEVPRVGLNAHCHGRYASRLLGGVRVENGDAAFYFVMV